MVLVSWGLDCIADAIAELLLIAYAFAMSRDALGKLVFSFAV